MLEKCLKSDIYVNETKFCDSLEQAVDVDFTLPDYCPDISKIFKCHAVPRIVSKSVNGNTVTVDGNVIITVLYCDKDGKFCSYEYQYPFSKNVDISNDITGANVFCRVKCDYINCRAVTGRKVDIHGAVTVFLKVFKRNCNEVVCDIDDCNVELNRISAPATSPMGYAEKYLLIEEEIRIGTGQPAIESILKVNSAACVKETKIINDKVVAKGELTVCVLYCPEGKGTPQAVKTVIGYSQIVDVDGITDNCECECKAEISSIEIKPKATSNGEIRCFALSGKILLTCEAYCVNEIPIIADAFSRKYETEIKRQKISFKKIACNVNEIYNCKKNLEFDFNVSSVIDVWCNVSNCHTKFEDGNILLKGTVTANLLLCDENNIPQYTEKNIDFEYKHPFTPESGTPFCEPEVEILSCGYTILSANNIELNAEIGINASIYEKNDISLIEDLTVDETKCKKREDDCAMIIYFTSKEETVWDIANKFSSSVKEIMSINNLESQNLTDGKMLLIPLN